MPSNNQENNGGDSPSSPIIDGSNNINLSETESSSAGQKNLRSNPETNTKHKKKKNTIVEIVSIPKTEQTEVIESNNISRQANRIANRSMYVNFSLFLITLVLAGVSFGQYISSKSAAQIAQRTFTETKKFDSITLDRQDTTNKRTNIADSIKFARDTATFNLQKEGLNKQIASLKETQNEFEIESRPFISIGNIAVDIPATAGKINYSALVGNSGKQPAYIIKCGYTFIAMLDSTFSDFKIVPEQPGKEKAFLPNNQTFPVGASSNDVISKEYLALIPKNKFFYYFIGYFNYRGFNKKKIYHLKFCYRAEMNPPHDSKVMYYSLY